MSIERQIESDGFKMAVSIDKSNTSPQTAMILCPGYLDSRKYPHLEALATAAAGEGLLAARLDPVGTWDSEGTEADYSVSKYLRNVADLRTYLENEYAIRRVIVGGHSLGGLVSILYAARARKSVQAAVALCPPQEMQGTAYPYWQQVGTRYTMRPLPGGIGMRPYRVPWTFVEDSSLPEHSALAAVKSYRTRTLPLFLLAGGQDTAVPTREVEGIFLAAQDRKRLEVVADMEHDYRTDPRQVDLVTAKVMDWLRTGGVLTP